MTFWTLIIRSLRFHARSHLGALLGAAVGSAVLIGALVVGDSIRQSLRDMALLRLGHVHYAMASGDRFFRDELSTDIGTASASALQVPATISTADNSFRANRVMVFGVANDFWKLSPSSSGKSRQLSDDSVFLNSALADHLKVKVGDTLLLRLQKPSLLSREAPISPQEDFSQVMRLKVEQILADEDFGRFSLQANQAAPFNAFLDRKVLQAKLGLTNEANLLLSAATPTNPNQQLKTNWQLADAELQLITVTNGNQIELRSKRIFLDEPVTRAAKQIATNATGILTYFVNELRLGSNSTPYSTITAADAPLVPTDMHDDEILINQWLADDLQAKAGDELRIRYFVMGTGKRLEEKTNSFRVRAIAPITGVHADRELMPEFPGIAKAEKTENWDAGFDLDMKRIRPKDEKYWKDYRGTPKAFVTLAAGQKMWANRFGNLTAVRFGENSSTPPPLSQIDSALRQAINPASLGLSFQNVREQALAAASQSENFGQLFIGFSFFLIVAALILMALMFQFGIEQRATEIGTLLALGFTPKQVRRLLLTEGLIVAALGSVIGIIGGIGYARAMIHALTTIWHSAVGTSSLEFHCSFETLVMGCLSGIIVSAITIWFVLRRQARQPARELLSEGSADTLITPDKKRRFAWSTWIAIGSGLCAVGLLGWAIADKQNNSAENFFSAGMLLLICALALVAMLLRRLTTAKSANHLSLSAMAVRGCARRRTRSLATVALLASGCFLIASIGAFRLDSVTNADKRSSGTGGFAFIAETTLPVVHDLNERSGREFFSLNESKLNDVSFVPFRVHDGDDASCLNLNRAQKPKLLGVNPLLLQQCHAFTFSEAEKHSGAQQQWELLNADGDEVPAIGDEASIKYALHKSIGDTLDYTDERGHIFKIRLVGAIANSILQGGLIIDEQAFLKRFPSESGYRMFLIDTPSNHRAETAAELSRGFRDVGMEVTPAAERLAQFNAVQNTYLSTFQILGGLGLLLGSAGLGVVVLRNVLERRSELAVLAAVGFRKRTLRWLIFNEHGVLLIVGLGIGVVTAVAAILPELLSPRGEIPYVSLGLTLGAVLLSGLLWTWLATRVALRGELLKALRNE